MPRRPKTEEEYDHDRFYRRMHFDLAKRVWDTPEGELSDTELLASLLGFSLTKKCDYIALAEELLDRYGSLDALLFSRTQELMTNPEIKLNTALLFRSIPTMCRLASLETRKPKRIKTSRDAEAYLDPFFFGYDYEQAYLLLLKDSDFPLPPVLIGDGTGSEVYIDPNKVLREALVAKSTKLILAHSHPFGSKTPSTNDLLSTVSLSKTLSEYGIRLLDHLVFGQDGCFSIAACEEIGSEVLAFSKNQPGSVFKKRNKNAGKATRVQEYSNGDRYRERLLKQFLKSTEKDTGFPVVKDKYVFSVYDDLKRIELKQKSGPK